MQGSKNSAILYFLSGIMMVVQAGVSLAFFDDGIGALAGGAFAFVMFVTMFLAYKGGLTAVMETTTVDGPGYRTTYSRDTGQRIQATPCCGICGGIMIFVIGFMFAEGLWEAVGDTTWLVLSPSIIGGILAILASIVFIAEYKGPWTGTAY
ncbi:MAG: hypothetical protein ACW98Y_05250 [Candidatus Thorarchaeota archaeon]|jgi:hypothetical protein